MLELKFAAGGHAGSMPGRLSVIKLCAAALLALAVLPVRADSLSDVVMLDIQSQPIEASLMEFSRQSGLQLIIPSGEMPARKAPRISGSMQVQAALRLLLGNTDLTYKLVGSRTITIVSSKGREVESKSGSATASRGDGGRVLLSRAGVAEAVAAAESEGDVRGTEAESIPTELVVQGTRETGVVNQGVIPRQENEAVRYTIISREDIERTGVSTMPELLRRLTSNQESGTSTQRAFAVSMIGTASSLVGGGDRINLRGLGDQQTLVMVNGRRLNSGADIGRIPLAAVERVEILPSSGSAIYGANSVAGVVNIIMRQDYQGTEFSGYMGASAGGGAEEYRFDLFHGMTFNAGRTSMTVGLSLQRFEALTRGQTGYDERVLSSPTAAPGSSVYFNEVLPTLVSPRGVIITRSPLGLGISSDPSAQYAAIPAGSDGIGLTPESFVSSVGQAFPSASRSNRVLVTQPSRNHAVMLNLEHALLGDALAFYGELTWRKDDASFYLPAATATVSMSATDPRNPFRTGVTPGFEGRSISIYRDPADLPDSFQGTVRKTARAVVGLKGKWYSAGGGAYNWAVDGSWDRNQARTEAVWSDLYGLPPQQELYNVLRDLTGVPRLAQEEWQKFGFTRETLLRPTIAAANLRLNGDLFRLWGGPAKFSVGAEWRREQFLIGDRIPRIGEYLFLPGGVGPLLTGQGNSETTREVTAAYAEVTLPLVGADNRRPGLYSLDVSAGFRYEDYDDFKAAQPPLFAVKLGLTPDVALRASWAEGFQPPTVSSLSAPQSTHIASGASYVDALRPGTTNPDTYIVYGGGNPDLEAETAKTWDAGVILTPRAIPGLMLNASYFRYDKRVVVSYISLTDAIVNFPRLVVRAEPSVEDLAAGRPGPVQAFNNIQVNIARLFSDGIDVNLRYDFPQQQWGRLTLMSSGTWTKRHFTQAQPGGAQVDKLGLAGFTSSFPLERRASATALWSRAGLSVSLTGNYTSSFESRTTTATARNPGGSGIDGDSIEGQWTTDLQFEYRLPETAAGTGGLRDWLGGTRWTVGALNVFDTMPALWTDYIRGFASPFVDPRQRYVYLQFKKSFE